MDISHVTWRKSRYSGGNGGNCVEVTPTPDAVIAVRDSKDPDGPRLAFTPRDWATFTTHIKSGVLSLP